jgi:hypothetical protein
LIPRGIHPSWWNGSRLALLSVHLTVPALPQMVMSYYEAPDGRVGDSIEFVEERHRLASKITSYEQMDHDMTDGQILSLAESFYRLERRYLIDDFRYRGETGFTRFSRELLAREPDADITSRWRNASPETKRTYNDAAIADYDKYHTERHGPIRWFESGFEAYVLSELIINDGSTLDFEKGVLKSRNTVMTRLRRRWKTFPVAHRNDWKREWKALSVEERAEWKQMARRDAIRYLIEIKAYSTRIDDRMRAITEEDRTAWRLSRCTLGL